MEVTPFQSDCGTIRRTPAAPALIGPQPSTSQRRFHFGSLQREKTLLALAVRATTRVEQRGLALRPVTCRGASMRSKTFYMALRYGLILAAVAGAVAFSAYAAIADAADAQPAPPGAQ